LLVLAILAVVTVIANGFNFLAFMRLADEAGSANPQLRAFADSAQMWIIIVSASAALIGLIAFVQLARMLLGLLGGEPQYVADAVKRIAGGDLNFSCSAFDRTFDVVIGHRGRFGLFDRSSQGRVEFDQSPTVASGNLDCFGQLSKQFPAGGILTPLAVLYICPF
jgi:hypothetical protein